MANIDYILKRIEGKENTIAKLKKKLERINKAKDSNWEINPYFYCESDIKSTEKEIKINVDSLEKLKQDLERERSKANSRNIPAITEFLDLWKERMFNYYSNGINEYYKESEKCHQMFRIDYDKACEMSKALRERTHGKFEKRPYTNRFGKISYESVKIADGDLEPYAEYFNWGSKEEAFARLNKDLEAEYNRKYDFIIERTIDIVHEITDASHLTIGAKGDLNGYIIGTKGTAKVQTIGAGGYNIQCFHFRTLINKL